MVTWKVINLHRDCFSITLRDLVGQRVVKRYSNTWRLLMNDLQSVQIEVTLNSSHIQSIPVRSFSHSQSFEFKSETTNSS